MSTPVTLATDCLHNCDKQCVSTFENATIANGTPGQVYGRGILNGMVTGFMAANQLTFQDALATVKSLVSHNTDFDEGCVPTAWLEDWRKIG